MCNENYHLEHHLYPGVPWYRLSEVHAALREELAARVRPTSPLTFHSCASLSCKVFVEARQDGGRREAQGSK